MKEDKCYITKPRKNVPTDTHDYVYMVVGENDIYRVFKTYEGACKDRKNGEIIVKWDLVNDCAA